MYNHIWKKFWCSAVLVYLVSHGSNKGSQIFFNSSVLHTLDSFQLLHFVIKIAELVLLLCTDVLRSIAESVIKSSLVVLMFY